MNFKERGITVGDLIIITIIVISSVFIFNKVNDKNEQTNLNFDSNYISTFLVS